MFRSRSSSLKPARGHVRVHLRCGRARPQHIVARGEDALRDAVFARGLLSAGRARGRAPDWVLPHLSSYYFHDRVVEGFERVFRDAAADGDGGGEEEEPAARAPRYWTNLADVGNIGAAAAPMLLHGALDPVNGPGLAVGETVLLAVPESGAFSYHFALFTVVDHRG